MSKRNRYPREVGATWASYDPERHGPIACKHTVRKGDRVCLIETQVSWFRSDDEVLVYCERCGFLKGHRPKSFKKLSAWRAQVAGLSRRLEKLRGQLQALPQEIEGIEREIDRYQVLIAKTETNLARSVES